MKMSTSLRKERAVRKRKRNMVKPKIRWNLLGLQDPACVESTPSMEEVRREINSMASRGPGAGTRSTSDAKKTISQSERDATAVNRKRRRGATK